MPVELSKEVNRVNASLLSEPKLVVASPAHSHSHSHFSVT
jgi:hypothetical protein